MQLIQLNSLGVLFALTAGLLISPPAHAQLTINLNPQAQSVIPGDALLFSGSMMNGQDNELFLDAVGFNFVADSTGTYFSSLPSDQDPFFNGMVPLSLLDTNDVYTGDIFGFQIANAVPSGSYDGTVTITSHYDGQTAFTTDQLFQFTVASAPVPEASTTVSLGLLLVLGLGGMVAARKRVRRPE